MRPASVALSLTLVLVGPSACGNDGDGETQATGGSEQATGGQASGGGVATGGKVSDSGGTAPSTGGTGTGGEDPYARDGLTGAPCTQDGDCYTIGGLEQFCNTDWPGGYCTNTCADQGFCFQRSGNSCAAVGDSTEKLCVRGCGTCREGYTCASVFPLTACIPSSLAE